MFKKCFLSAFLIIIFSFSSKTFGQNLQQEVLEELLEFHSKSKEIAYLHLNKTLLLQGEQLGFSAYILNPNDFKPSTQTTNLYVQIKDQNQRVVKEKMLLIENGTGATTIDIDSTFASSKYSITAFTNWMRNFKQQYYFTEEFQVVRSNLDNEKTIVKNEKIDAQFLPESGHLLQNIYNDMGIVIKDSLGYGLENASVRILNQANKLVGNTRLNQFGIGEISFVPTISDSYKALIYHNGKTYTENITTPVEIEGIVINTNIEKDTVEVFLNTNTETIENSVVQSYIFSVQNTTNATTYEFNFEGQPSILFSLPFEDLKPGMNVFTVFDQNKKAVAERLFFNHRDLPVFDLEKATIQNNTDSISVTLPTKKFADSTFLSVSILPKNTGSFKRNHNIASYFLIQPYIKGAVENGSWYFSNIDDEKIIALDQLLLTQGWSSYDWRSIFNAPEETLYNFERYVDIKAQINNSKDKDQRFLIHASTTNDPAFIDIPEGKDSFIFEGMKPLEGESLFISRLKNKGGLQPAGLSVQFFPHHIKDFTPNAAYLPQKVNVLNVRPDPYFFNFNKFGNDIEQLDEVLVETKVDTEKMRERQLNNHKWGRVDVLNESDKMMFVTLGDYLQSKGLIVSKTPGDFSVQSSLNLFGSRNTESSMAIYFNDMIMFDTGYLYQFPISDVDYVEINKTGMGSGFIGASGSIKIYSDMDLGSKTDNIKRLQQFDFPISYANNKQFYVPKYGSKSDEFFQEYGVIDWKSDLFSEGNKDIRFEIEKPQVDYQMIIEGFTAAGDLIYDVQTFEVN